MPALVPVITAGAPSAAKGHLSAICEGTVPTMTSTCAIQEAGHRPFGSGSAQTAALGATSFRLARTSALSSSPERAKLKFPSS